MDAIDHAVKDMIDDFRTRNYSAENLSTEEQLQDIREAIAFLGDKIEKMDTSVYHAANTASCLANGIKPD